jgi:CRISPR-associated endonuclease Csn1
MKRILGLDLGTTSIGWALVNEAESAPEKSSIEKLGVRVNPISTDEMTNFEKGKSITTTAERTLARGMRRNLQRYKLRRANLIEVLREGGILKDDTILSEVGNNSTFKTYAVRAKAPMERIALEDVARVLLMINKKRGYKSNRKAKGGDDGQLIDGMAVAKLLKEENLTPGQYALRVLESGKRFVPDFYQSDLKAELDRIWAFQKPYHPELLTDELWGKMEGKGKEATSKLIYALYKVDTAENKGTRDEKRLQPFQWRAAAISQPLSAAQVAFVIKDVNGEINGSSGYLGAISDRSKELYFGKKTVGQYLYEQIAKDPHTRLKNQVFYRQDYLDEFNAIWTEQAKHHKELTDELMEEVRDVVIFYQRRLKSQKGLISFCEFEQKQIEVVIDGKKKIKTRGLRVCPKSSPLFQEFRIWQVLNNLELTQKGKKNARAQKPNDQKSLFAEAEDALFVLDIEAKQALFNELTWRKGMPKAEALKMLFKEHASFDLNFKELEGNRTNAALLEVYQRIVEASGHDAEFSKLTAAQSVEKVREVFAAIGINTAILDFNADVDQSELEKQPSYQLWHLLYSYEEDKSATGDANLVRILQEKYGFEPTYARMVANVTFQEDYASLSTKAIRKILPHLKDGLTYDVACDYAGYNHSHSLDKEERANRVLKAKLDILPKNSLRNPVVEKILNQMVHVVNGVSEAYGKPDEIRIELARELKKSAKEREDMTKNMDAATKEHEEYRKLLKEKFGLSYVSRNDIIRYKLYLELKGNGFKTLYSNTYIPLSTADDGLFSKKFDIEHIIPQAKLFDDSFSNKTLELRSENREKGDDTALAFIKRKYGEEKVDEYRMRVENLLRYKEKDEGRAISRTKYNKLMMDNDEIPEGFIDRDLRDTQYIAKKAKAMLEEVFRTVNTTTGTITDRLREDWQLVDVMQELNWEKYKALGLTYYEHNREGKPLPRIKDWTKRNDHRHHAMDALTVAFTRYNHVQYLNNLNARSNKEGIFYGIEQKELTRDEKGKLRFNPPMPLNEFRAKAKEHLEAVLISYKAKNKVVTRNRNVTAKKGGSQSKVELTPRGQLHKQTVYGRNPWTRIVLNEKVTKKQIELIADQRLKDMLEEHIAACGGIGKAFTPAKLKDLIYKGRLLTEVVINEPCYTERLDLAKYAAAPGTASSKEATIESILDPVVREKIRERYQAHGKDFKKAFSNLEQDPIWMNKEKGIKIKKVIITGISTATPLHYGKDKDGKPTLDAGGNPIPVDFVSTGNNHHVAIYRDEKGNLQEQCVSFYEAVMRVNQGLDIIDRHYRADEGWQFLFTMKQNEYFVFPNAEQEFDPNEIDLVDAKNFPLISPNLFRVQKTTVRDYFFRHHLETTVENIAATKGYTWKREGLKGIEGIVKVRINHVGRIVQVGEY